MKLADQCAREKNAVVSVESVNNVTIGANLYSIALLLKLIYLQLLKQCTAHRSFNNVAVESSELALQLRRR